MKILPLGDSVSVSFPASMSGEALGALVLYRMPDGSHQLGIYPEGDKGVVEIAEQVSQLLSEFVEMKIEPQGSVS